jgi:hypothetical protein
MAEKRILLKKIDSAGRDWIMNIRDNFNIYSFKFCNKLIDEQKPNENNHKNILFEIAVAYTDIYGKVSCHHN